MEWDGRPTATWKSALAVVAVGAGALLLNCGGTASGSGRGSGSGSEECGSDSACGGNLAGRWIVAHVCVPSASMLAGCPTLEIDASGLSVTGDITFQSDGTYTSSLAASGGSSINIPSACLTSGGFSCDAFDARPQGPSAAESATVTCTSSSDGCACAVQIEPQTSAASGTYTTTDGNLSLTPSTGSAIITRYCVQGSTLTLASTTLMTSTSLATIGVALTKD
jgi:hypothetical protein